MTLSLGMKEALTRLGAIDASASARINAEIMELLVTHPRVNVIKEMLDGKAKLTFRMAEESPVGEFIVDRGENEEPVIISANFVKWRVA